MPLPKTDLPYAVHTNHELGLMLAGAKLLAMFVDKKDCFPHVLVRYLRLFNRHVASGRFVRRDHFSRMSPSYISHRVLFALPSEAWRIDAMIELKDSKHWSDAHERREGELLGYENWKNDYWINLLNSR